MIFLCGIPSEPSLGLVVEQLRELEAPHVLFHQRRFLGMELDFEIAAGEISGRMRYAGQDHRLEDFTAVYTRLMDYRLLPEIEDQPEDSAARLYCANLHASLMQWYEIAPGRVLNRSHELGLCYSKALQSQVIRRNGFEVPETLVTNDPDLVREFHQVHGRLIYKSLSYVRSIVDLMDQEDLDRLDAVRACPVQFQQYIDGANVRVHTVGERVFPTLIRAPTVDYRYAYLEGERESLEPMDLSPEVTERCLALAAAFRLEFAGIDLKITDDGRIYCLEVNPSPAFSYYQLHTGQPIARAVAEHLAGG